MANKHSILSKILSGSKKYVQWQIINKVYYISKIEQNNDGQDTLQPPL